MNNQLMLDIIMEIFNFENIPYEVINDPIIIIKHKCGCINPNMVCGVYAYPNDPKLCKIITDFYEAVNYINDKGLRQI
jgi:hypothetical protein